MGSRKASKSAHEDTKLIEQSATTSQEVVNKKNMANTPNSATIQYPKTTMVVRLQPGEDKTLSAYLDEQVVDPSEPGGSSYKRRWLTDVSADKGSKPRKGMCVLHKVFVKSTIEEKIWSDMH